MILLYVICRLERIQEEGAHYQGMGGWGNWYREFFWFDEKGLEAKKTCWLHWFVSARMSLNGMPQNG